jgi:hypothetical protein
MTMAFAGRMTCEKIAMKAINSLARSRWLYLKPGILHKSKYMQPQIPRRLPKSRSQFSLLKSLQTGFPVEIVFDAKPFNNERCRIKCPDDTHTQ